MFPMCKIFLAGIWMLLILHASEAAVAQLIVPGVGAEAQGADVAVAAVGWNIDGNGNATEWSRTIGVPGVGWEAQGAGVAVFNIDSNPPRATRASACCGRGEKGYATSREFSVSGHGKAELIDATPAPSPAPGAHEPATVSKKVNSSDRWADTGIAIRKAYSLWSRRLRVQLLEFELSYDFCFGQAKGDEGTI
jgi:hypothetical protein